MTREQPKAKGGARAGRRTAGVCALLAVAWLAGRGFMVGGASQAARPEANRSAAAPLPQADAGDAARSAPAAPAAEARVAAAPPSSTSTAPTDAGLEPDRFAALSAALALHAQRSEFAACAAAWRHLDGLPLSTTQRATCEATVASARQALADRLGQAGALLAAGRAAAAVRALGPLREPGFAGSSARDLLPVDVAVAVGAWLDAQVATDAGVPAPRPLARGRLVTAVIGGAEARGVCVAADAESVTLQVRRDDGSSFPRARYADCDPDDVTGAEAIELGFAAVRAGEPALARCWLSVANARGAGGHPRMPTLARSLR